MNPYLLILIIIGIVVIGGGGVYLFYVLSRPKKQSWSAKIYTLTAGVRPPIKDKKGNVISTLERKEIRPFATDIIQRRELATGITAFYLVKMNKPCPPVTSDVVEYWEAKSKVVSLLLDQDCLTPLRKSYDATSGDILFDPISYDRRNMIITESEMRKERLEGRKGLLEKLALYITIGILCLSLVAVAYFQGNSAIKVSENNLDAAKLYQTKWPAAEISGEPGPDVQQENPPLIDAG